MSADVRIDFSAGCISAGDVKLGMHPVMASTAIQVGGEDGPIIRALHFGERFTVVSQAAGSLDPADAVARMVLNAATVEAGTRKFSEPEQHAIESLALSLAGADNIKPGYLNALMHVAHATGWSMQQIDAAPADRIDQMALQLKPEQADDGWTKIKFAPGAGTAADNSAAEQTSAVPVFNIRKQLALNLLQRLDSGKRPQLHSGALGRDFEDVAFADDFANVRSQEVATFGDGRGSAAESITRRDSVNNAVNNSVDSSVGQSMDASVDADNTAEARFDARSVPAADDEFFADYPLAESSARPHANRPFTQAEAAMLNSETPDSASSAAKQRSAKLQAEGSLEHSTAATIRPGQMRPAARNIAAAQRAAGPAPNAKLQDSAASQPRLKARIMSIGVAPAAASKTELTTPKSVPQTSMSQPAARPDSSAPHANPKNWKLTALDNETRIPQLTNSAAKTRFKTGPAPAVTKVQSRVQDVNLRHDTGQPAGNIANSGAAAPSPASELNTNVNASEYGAAAKPTSPRIIGAGGGQEPLTPANALRAVSPGFSGAAAENTGARQLQTHEISLGRVPGNGIDEKRTSPNMGGLAQSQTLSLTMADSLARLLNEEADLRGLD